MSEETGEGAQVPEQSSVNSFEERTNTCVNALKELLDKYR